MYRVRDYISIDKEVLAGNPVFRGTRVPVRALFDHLEHGVPLEEFLSDFPTVKKEQAIAVIEIAGKILSSKPGHRIDLQQAAQGACHSIFPLLQSWC
jgi:uncharacterized protein (DUF433 family)